MDSRRLKLVRPLTPREVAEFQRSNLPQPGERRRRAGIEELRRALNDRFGAERVREVPHG